ncbi:unnamed protein product [Prorocentrum cordatum]|uniref:Uncharacterized protein n=1 Tax=Prorocentrum cordatum TaxID=2364126 RepID=A0ABN9V5F5_9DINO|nr:unnamed protein product [Polarella glacialis]
MDLRRCGRKPSPKTTRPSTWPSWCPKPIAAAEAEPADASASPAAVSADAPEAAKGHVRLFRYALDALTVLLLLDGCRRWRNHGQPKADGSEDAPPRGSEAFQRLVRAAAAGDEATARELLRGGASASEADLWGCTALHAAAKGGARGLAAQLLDLGADLHAADAWDDTPLHTAARAGRAGVCGLLVERGARLDAANAQSWTPLVVAGHAEHRDVCLLLLGMGAGVGGLPRKELPALLRELLPGDEWPTDEDWEEHMKEPRAFSRVATASLAPNSWPARGEQRHLSSCGNQDRLGLRPSRPSGGRVRAQAMSAPVLAALAAGGPCRQAAPPGRRAAHPGTPRSAAGLRGTAAGVLPTAASLLLAGRRPARRAARAGRRRPGAAARRALSQYPGGQDVGEPFTLVAGAKAIELGPACRLVHLVRHAEALVNAAGRVFPKGDPRKKAVRQDAQYFDSPLSERGLAQSRALRAGALEGRAVPPAVGLVASSTLTRALQTSTEAFGCADTGGPRLVAHEALREFCSKDFQPCDSRRPPADLSSAFPHADFRHVPPGPDALLAPGKVETPESADARIRWFFAWLREQPERNVACVAHFQILTRILKNHLEPAGFNGSSYGDLTNLEIRSVPIAFL